MKALVAAFFSGALVVSAGWMTQVWTWYYGLVFLAFALVFGVIAFIAFED